MLESVDVTAAASAARADTALLIGNSRHDHAATIRYGAELVAAADPELAEALEAERRRQKIGLELIASENFVSPAVMAAMGSVMTNKYAEGYPGRRYYGGCEHVDVGENIAREVMLERDSDGELNLLRRLGFGHCRLSVAVPEDSGIDALDGLRALRIATSYPALTRDLLEKQGIRTHISELSGSVEIAPSMGTADAISDLVSTGTTQGDVVKQVPDFFCNPAAPGGGQSIRFQVGPNGKKRPMDRAAFLGHGVSSTLPVGAIDRGKRWPLPRAKPTM